MNSHNWLGMHQLDEIKEIKTFFPRLQKKRTLNYVSGFVCSIYGIALGIIQ